MKITEENIYEFHGEYKPSNNPPKEDGAYMTIRCGLGGIYTMLDEWKDGKWQVGVTDASRVIAYSRERISEEDVKRWCFEKMKKFRQREI